MAAPGSFSHHSFFATCPRNTEGLLLDELRALGVETPQETRGGVSFRGGLREAYRVCLWSRVADRVIMRLISAPVTSPDDLYELVAQVPWEDHVASQGTVAVEATSSVSLGPLAQINTHFLEQRAKDALVDRFRRRTGSRPTVDRIRPDVRLNLHLAPSGGGTARRRGAGVDLDDPGSRRPPASPPAETEATVGLDLSGSGLHRRGYRLQRGDAPLRENLAAAILLRTGWPEFAAQGRPLLDPLCGSGTLLLEGALMAADVAPGLNRDYFGFLGWAGHRPEVWAELLHEAEQRRTDGNTKIPPIFGYDSDPKVLAAARANARRAGLAGSVLFDQRELASLVPPGPDLGTGLLVTNPPYGKRLGEVAALVPLYELLGERLRARFSGWEAVVFTGNPELPPHLGLRAHRANTLFNGPLACRLLRFHVGADFAQPRRAVTPGAAEAGAHSVEAVASASPKRSDTAKEQRTRDVAGSATGADMFANRLAKNYKHLRRWAAREGITCYRLYDADLPEYAAAIDLYEDRIHIQEYAPPATVDPVQARRRLKEMMAKAPLVLGLPATNAVLKIRRPQRGTAQYERLAQTGVELQVTEGGLRFLVNLTDYLDTGLFLDHRPTRALIRDLAGGRRFLNLFAYTGTATVYAAAGGATTTTTVDLSSTYLSWAQRNLELNGMHGERHHFVRADCLEWLADRHEERYDLAFLDAPTFSNSKSMARTLDIQRDHADLIRATMRLLSPQGILIFSSNYRRFRLDPQLTGEFAVTDLTKRTIPPDFARNPRIHSCYRISRSRGEEHRPWVERTAHAPRATDPGWTADPHETATAGGVSEFMGADRTAPTITDLGRRP